MWSRLDDSLLDHEKIERAAELFGKRGLASAVGLFTIAVLHANRQLTDGVISKRTLAKYQISDKDAAVMTEVGLWEQCADGYRIHDFHEWNPSAAAVKAKRAKDRERKRKSYGFHEEIRAEVGAEEHAEVKPDSESEGATHSGRIPASPAGARDRDPNPLDAQSLESGATRNPLPLSLAKGQVQLAVLELVSLWNQDIPQPLVAVTTDLQPASVARVARALQAKPSLSWWQARITQVRESEFLTARIPGRDGEFFTADFWWLLENADKVQAGRYRNRAKAKDAAAVDADRRRQALERESAPVLALGRIVRGES